MGSPSAALQRVASELRGMLHRLADRFPLPDAAEDAIPSFAVDVLPSGGACSAESVAAHKARDEATVVGGDDFLGVIEINVEPALGGGPGVSIHLHDKDGCKRTPAFPPAAMLEICDQISSVARQLQSQRVIN